MAHAGELVGERWALLVIRELLLGPKRFTDLRAGIPRVSPNVLGQRLRELEASGVVRRRTLPPPAGSKVYELTDWGRELEPVALGLGAWAARSPGFPRDGGIGPDSLFLAHKAIFDPGAAGDLSVTVAYEVDGQDFTIAVADGALDVRRGKADDPDLRVVTSVETLNEVVMGGRPVDDAVGSSDMSLEGSRELFDALLGALAVPEPAPPAEPVPA